MKKILFMFLLMIPFFVYGECDSKVTISKLELNEKKGYAEELEPSSYECNNIKLNIKMYNKDDSVIYNLTIKNNSDDDIELNNKFSSDSEYIEYKIEDSNLIVEKGKEKTFKLSATYTKLASPTLLVNGTIEDNHTMNLSITSKEENPNTSATNIAIMIAILILAILTIILSVKSVRATPRYMSLLIIPVLVIPTIVYALTKFEIKLEAKVVIAEPKEKAIEPEEEQNNEEQPPVEVVHYPEGKTKATVEVGDIVTIDTEEFYVVKHDGSDLVLLAHYNLNVGSNKKASATEGIQDSEVKGSVLGGTKYGNVAFSSTNYWSGKVGSDYSGSYCSSNTYTAGTNCAYVYDSNSNLKTYVDQYKIYLEGQGATIKAARLLRVEEAYELGCGNGPLSTAPQAPSWVYETSYWIGSAFDTDNLWRMYSLGTFGSDYYLDSSTFGVRPVIVI